MTKQNNSAVMCCGCNRFMGIDGKPLTALDLKDPVSATQIYFGPRSEIDATAQSFGWSVEDAKGPNHRCPECLAGTSTREPHPIPGGILRGSSEPGRDFTQGYEAEFAAGQDSAEARGAYVERTEDGGYRICP